MLALVDFRGGGTRRTNAGRSNRLEAMRGRAPVNQAARNVSCGTGRFFGRRDRIINVNLVSVVVSSGADASLRLQVWGGQGKESRDYRTCHQGELQVFSHDRVEYAA